MGAHFQGWLEVVVVANNHCPQEQAYTLVFKGDGRWCTGGGGCNMPPSRMHMRSFLREMGGGALVAVDGTCHPQKQPHMLVLKGSEWWCWQTTTSLKDKHTRSFSREMGGGGGGCNMPPS